VVKGVKGSHSLCLNAARTDDAYQGVIPNSTNTKLTFFMTLCMAITSL